MSDMNDSQPDRPLEKRLFYDSIADQFESLANQYDLHRRLEIVFEGLLMKSDLDGSLVLDAGCGYGAFSSAAIQAGAVTIACDISRRLAAITASRLSLPAIVCDLCNAPFAPDRFDVVISSEVIEHTDCADRVIKNLAQVLKPGGLLALTTPNKAWEWLVVLASRLKLRPFRGIEDFLRWRELERLCIGSGLLTSVHCGFHPWPFQARALNGLSRCVDRWFGRTLFGRFMINQAILAVKSPS